MIRTMREIKFRGRTPKGEWLYGDLEYRRATGVAVIHTYNEDGTYNRQEEVNPDTVGQFTGLYDKNGKEIYEGDFVRYHMHERDIHESEYQTGLVEFGGGRFYADLDCSTLYFCGDSEDYEVIGNKWDNPEL